MASITFSKNIFLIFNAVIIFLVITREPGNCELRENSAEQKHASLRADAFLGESLSYDLGFWIFKKAATGSITFTKDKRGYVALLEAQTCGFMRLIVGHKNETMKSIMDYDEKKGRFRPLMFQEVFTQGDNEIKKTVSFDYDKATYTVSRQRANKKTTRITKKLPKKEFDDLLTFFYNFRLGYYGDVNKRKTFSVYVLVKNRPSYIFIAFDEGQKAKKGTGEYYATVSMDRNISAAGTKMISGWFSKDFVPLDGVVEDAYFFGDIQLRLKERKLLHPDRDSE